MSLIRNIQRQILPFVRPGIVRSLSTTPSCNIKEIQVGQENNAIVIKAVSMESPRSAKLMKDVCQPNFCPECTLGLNIKHTDVLVLSQFVRSDGCMLPRRITGLCKRQQKRIGTMVSMAQKAGLMPNLTPENSKKDPKKRREWKKFNKYFDENTIKCKNC
ncbi:unnamed protein product [Hermetia illucens]|uniref:Large ribosomal subunit protein mL66 n=1 Tax=Hermetia illucens TaxID=343691 RepID=A0A7R8Z0Q6_HERIL|nr:28S ribosomal protein S18a, mitochondrial [Hermetia illucens]CAD7092859.1 unnamed protein product [Hermetia illucens]